MQTCKFYETEHIHSLRNFTVSLKLQRKPGLTSSSMMLSYTLSRNCYQLWRNNSYYKQFKSANLGNCLWEQGQDCPCKDRRVKGPGGTEHTAGQCRSCHQGLGLHLCGSHQWITSRCPLGADHLVSQEIPVTYNVKNSKDERELRLGRPTNVSTLPQNSQFHTEITNTVTSLRQG